MLEKKERKRAEGISSGEINGRDQNEGFGDSFIQFDLILIMI